MPEELLPQLKAVLEKALAQAPRLVGSNLDVVLADANSYMADARRYPNVYMSLSNSYAKENRFNAFNNAWKMVNKPNYGLTINQPLWHWGILEAASQTGKIGKEIARHNYAEAYRMLALEVRAAYLQAILHKMSARNAVFAHKLARENLKRQESRFQAAQMTMGEIMAVRLAADEASLAARRAATDLDFVLRNFRRLTGIADFSEADVPDTIPGVEQTPVAAQPVDMAVLLESNGAKNSELDLRRTQLDFRSAKYSRYPKLNAVGGFAQDEISYTQNIENKYRTRTLYIGLQLSWNIFDGPSTKGQQLAGLTRIRQAERARDNYRDILRQQADTEALNVGYASEAMRNAAMKLRFAREGAASMRDNAARGQASQEQVDNAQNWQNTAEYQFHSAVVGYLNTAAQYLSTAKADPFAQSPVQP